MLSIRGKGYSKIHSENPFYEDPQPKAFYHPTQEKALSQAEKQLKLSPRAVDRKRRDDKEEQQLERKFLSGGHDIRPLTSVQTHVPKSPDSTNFDESWPDSERPSSPSVTAEDKWGQDSLPYASVRKHAQPTFTSRPLTSDLSSNPSDYAPVPHASSVPSYKAADMLRHKLEEDQSVPLQKGQKTGSKQENAGGSVLQRYIERFRHGTPMSREERLQMESSKKDDFWWLHSDHPVPNSTSTPKEGEGRSLPFTCQGRGTLTVENVRKRDDLDIATAQLQAKADRVLHSAGSIASTGPVVSTEGLGSTGSDITGSSFSEPVVRPSFLPREVDAYHKLHRASDKGGALVRSPEDILYKWRLQRKLETARQRPYVPSQATTQPVPKTAAEKDIEKRLAGFRENLLGGGSVVRTQLQEARVEKDMKHICSMMDSAVQTSPARNQPAPTHPSPWFHDSKTDPSYQNNNLTPHLHNPHHPPTRHELHHHNFPHSAHDFCGGRVDSKAEQTSEKRTVEYDGSKESVQFGSCAANREVQYRQFLEAERPQDGGDGRWESVSVPAGNDQALPDSDDTTLNKKHRQNGTKGSSVDLTAASIPSQSSNNSKSVSASSVPFPSSTTPVQGSSVPVWGSSAQDLGSSTPIQGFSSPVQDSSVPNVGSSKSKPRSSKSAQESSKSESKSSKMPSSSSGSVQCVAQNSTEQKRSKYVVLPHEAGDGSFSEDQVAKSVNKESRRTALSQQKKSLKSADNDADSDSGSAHSLTQAENDASSTRFHREGEKDGGDNQTLKKHSGNKTKLRAESSLQHDSNTNNNEAGIQEGRSQQNVDTLVQEDCDNVGQNLTFKRPPTDAGSHSRSKMEERSGVIPGPQYSSSPARGSLSSVVGQVVHDRLFDASVSMLSSVDSLSSLHHSAISPSPSFHKPAAQDDDNESDGEFENDSLLTVLRQQRQAHERQLRLLDAVLSERDMS